MDSEPLQNISRLDPAAARQNLADLIDQHGTNLSALSRLIERNAAYLQQYLARGVPERLAEDDRLKLAQYFEVDERLLGAREPWSPAKVVDPLP